MKQENHRVDICVVGGGMAGIAAALSAARHGATVALIHDRPVLGGGSSSESRVHICGADRVGGLPLLRETGILEELRLANLRCNPNQNHSIWDNLLYEKLRFEPNLRLFLNTTCISAQMDGSTIKTITGWQMTTQTYHEAEAKIFIDCSGDAILAPLSGALWRMGREARSEYHESHAPEAANSHTMGMSLLFQARDMGSPQPFEPPAHAYDFPNEDDLPYGLEGHQHLDMGYWWVEQGGEGNNLERAEEVRDELLKIIWGVWDHIKNHCRDKEKATNYAIEWIQFLPTKRETRRYISDYVMTQNDVEAGGKFDDIVAYGGWAMDDHHSGGFHHPDYKKQATIFYPTPSPYGISYRCLYSKNIENLLFAGRCAGFSHMALSSARVMGTCTVMGQAVGTAAALGVKYHLLPKEVGTQKRTELQQALLADDCYLPGLKQEFPLLVQNATLRATSGDPEPLRDGFNRPIGESLYRWDCRVGDSVEYIFDHIADLKQIVIAFDSDFTKNIQMSRHGRYGQLTSLPARLVKAFHIDVFDGSVWKTLAATNDNNQRLVRLDVKAPAKGIRLTIDQTWGERETGVYALYCL